MPFVRIEYSYKQYRDCPKASFVSKWANHPVGQAIIGFAMCFLLVGVGGIFIWLAELTGWKIFASVAMFVIVVAFISIFVGPLLIRWLVNREDGWAERIAYSEGYAPRTEENSWVCKCGITRWRSDERCIYCNMVQPPYQKRDITPLFRDHD